MDNQSREIIIGHVLSLIEIMENTSDKTTKDRLDRQINQLMKDFNLTWKDDM